MREYHAQFARLRGDHGIHRRTEVHYQRRRRAARSTWLVYLRGEMDRNITDKQAARGLVEIYRFIEETLEQRGECAEWHQSAAVFEKEAAGKIEVLSLNPRPRLAVGELSFHIVVTQLPHPPISPCRDRSQWLQNLQQPHVVAVAFNYRERVVGGRGVNRKLLSLRRARKKSRAGEKKCGHQTDSQSALP